MPLFFTQNGIEIGGVETIIRPSKLVEHLSSFGSIKKVQIRGKTLE
jgi:hypothetical protein